MFTFYALAMVRSLPFALTIKNSVYAFAWCLRQLLVPICLLYVIYLFVIIALILYIQCMFFYANVLVIFCC